MKKLLWGLLVIVLICVAAVCFRQSQQHNEFTSDIDLLIERTNQPRAPQTQTLKEEVST